MKRREMYAAYKNYEELKKKYPLRDVSPDKHIENDTFYYVGHKGYLRKVKMLDNSIWENDHENPPFLKRIR